jgi:cyanate lyase
MAFDHLRIEKSKSVSEFLSIVVEQCKDRPISYSELGRLSGIKSRSHPREIVLGKKRVSLETARQISRGLKLPSDLKELNKNDHIS